MDLLRLRDSISKNIYIEDMQLRVTFYARVSTEKDSQLNSLDNQIFYYEDYIRGNANWEFVDGYIDEGISGKKAENRESFMRMISDAKSGRFDLILTKEISRFSRNTLDSIKYTQELLRHGVGVFFQSDNINTLMPDSELRLTIMASIAQEEVRKLSERLRFGYKRAIEKGRVLGQTNILGYDKQDGVLTINEEEAAIVRRIFALYNEGRLGIRAIARQLEREGMVSPNTGKMFTFGTIKSVLTNPKYKGFYCSRRTVTLDYRNTSHIRQPESEWILFPDESIPAIVSEEVWDRANQLYKQRGENARTHTTAYRSRYPLSGKIICGEHGDAFHRHVYKSKRNGEQEVWNCRLYRLKGKKEGCDSPTLYSGEIYEILSRLYRELVDHRDAVIGGLMELYGSVEEKDYAGEISKTRTRIAELEQKQDALFDFLLSKAFTQEQFEKQNSRIEAELAKLADELEEIESRKSASINRKANLSRLRKDVEAILDQPDLYVDELSATLLDRIVVHKIGGDKRNVRLDIHLTTGTRYQAEVEGKRCISLQEIGISQAQVSRLEKSAMKRIKKQI